MVNREFIAALDSALVAIATKNGVPSLPEVCQKALADYYGEAGDSSFQQDELNLCTLEIPAEFALENWPAIQDLSFELGKVKGVSKAELVSHYEWLKDGEDCEIDIFVEDGLWSKSEEELWEEICKGREKGDPEMVAKYNDRMRRQQEERRRHWRDNVIPIPPPAASRPKQLYLTMAYEPYDQIKSGEKVTEFREYDEYWVRRILANRATLDTVKFQRGYGGCGRPSPEQMIWTIKNIELYDIETRESCDPDNIREGFVATHIAIDLGIRMDDIGPGTQRDK